MDAKAKIKRALRSVENAVTSLQHLGNPSAESHRLGTSKIERLGRLAFELVDGLLCLLRDPLYVVGRVIEVLLDAIDILPNLPRSPRR